MGPIEGPSATVLLAHREQYWVHYEQCHVGPTVNSHMAHVGPERTGAREILAR